MARIARAVAVGIPHHITQRGNYQQAVFSDVEDRERYSAWIQEYSNKYGLSIYVNNFMLNHVHFIAVPHEKDSLARVFNTAHMRYSQYFNKKFKRGGHLWQGRFYSCALDEDHLIHASRYIERNPVRAGLVEKPWDWPWSSAREHVTGNTVGSIISADLLDLIGMSRESWKEFIGYSEKPEFLNSIRLQTHTGRPLGSEEFVCGLEQQLERKLRAGKRGTGRNGDSDLFAKRSLSPFPVV